MLELGPRDLEPVYHDPHCILVDEDATDNDATDEVLTDEDATDELHPRMRITPGCASPLDAHHPLMRITP